MIRQNKAFTLIELVVVIGIILVLFMIASIGVNGAANKTRLAACKTSLKRLHQSVMIYMTEFKAGKYNSFPERLDENFLAKYVGTTSAKLKCGFAKEGILGYKINNLLVSGLGTNSLDSANTDNVLLYEVDEDKDSNAPSLETERHNGIAYGVDLFGNLIELKRKNATTNDEKLAYK